MKKNLACLAVIVATFCCMISQVFSEEYSILSKSTIIGRNFGFPNGTPMTGNTPVSEVDFIIETAFFFKNLELIGFNQQTGIDGETFFGFLTPLRIRYRAHQQVTVETGGVFGQDFGDEDKLNIAEPLLRLVYEPTDDLFIIAGTIFPTHWIHDAILDDVQKLRLNAEQGLQLRIDFNCFKQDTWINWHVREDTWTAEEFDVGNTSRLNFFQNTLHLNGELLYAHAGGQKNLTNRVEHNITMLGGSSYGFFHPFNLEAVKEMRFGANYFYSIDDDRGKSTESGDGWELYTFMDSFPKENILLRIHGSYFDGSDFLARRGDPLYGLDHYGQVGAVAIFNLPAGLRIETSFVRQFTRDDYDDLENYTVGINLIWGDSFFPNFLQARKTQDN